MDEFNFHTNAINEGEKKRLGMYFSTNEKYARCYGDKLLKADLLINNPFDLRANPNGCVNAKEFVKRLPISTKLKMELSMGIRETFAYGLIEGALKENLIETVKSLGHDGIVFNEGYGETWIPFYPDQIKLVTEENATYFHGTNHSF